MEEFLRRLKSRREELGLTLKEVAWKFGVTQNTLERIESGDFSGVELYVKSLLLRYCELLGIDETEGLEAYHEWKKKVNSGEVRDKRGLHEERRFQLVSRDVIVLVLLHVVTSVLVVATWVLFAKLDEFRRYTVLFVTNPTTAPLVVEVEKGRDVRERRVLLGGETVKYRLDPKESFSFTVPGGEVELRLGKKLWKVKLDRFRVEVKDGNPESP